MVVAVVFGLLVVVVLVAGDDAVVLSVVAEA